MRSKFVNLIEIKIFKLLQKIKTTGKGKFEVIFFLIPIILSRGQTSCEIVSLMQNVQYSSGGVRRKKLSQNKGHN